jgi:hypothetical protein
LSSSSACSKKPSTFRREVVGDFAFRETECAGHHAGVQRDAVIHPAVGAHRPVKASLAGRHEAHILVAELGGGVFLKRGRSLDGLRRAIASCLRHVTLHLAPDLWRASHGPNSPASSASFSVVRSASVETNVPARIVVLVSSIQRFASVRL